MARVYLDTSFVSACVTTRQDAASIVRRETSLEWMDSQAEKHDLFISPEVVIELDDPTFPSRDAAMNIIESVPLLMISEQVLGVATILVYENVMPGPDNAGDALHVAVSAVHRMDYLLSWNVRHLANPNKTQHLQVVCSRLGLIPPTIITPEILWEETP